MTLFNQNVDVIAFHTGSTAVMVAAQERGKLAVAYHSDMRKVAPDAQIVAVTHQWGDYYTRARPGRAGRQLEERQCLGRREGGHDPRRRFRPQGAQGGAGRRCWRARKTLPAASCSRLPARSSDNEGHEVVPKGQAMTDAQILAMNFLVSGVQGKIAK